ncbi:chorismate mutase [Candidatus Alkanophaga liquidiphilum]|nr:Chorismate mutase [Candidatus Alkanophaga liquidiphilum]RLG37516.1 MAG: chorismate mutase [Candidatus Alkanophagales archaeon]
MKGEARTLKQIREEIENIDAQIIELIAKRTALAEELLAAKLREGTNIVDKEQRKRVLERVAREASRRGMDAVFITKIFEILITMNENRQKELAAMPKNSTGVEGGKNERRR